MEAVQIILKEMAAGPLRKIDVSFLYEDAYTTGDVINSFIKSFGKPLTIHPINKDITDKEFKLISERKYYKVWALI